MKILLLLLIFLFGAGKASSQSIFDFSSPDTLGADPADCSANNFAISIAANGDLTCDQVHIVNGTTNTLTVARGGTGLTTTPTNGQVLIGNGANFTLSTITGTANRVTVTDGAGSITLSSPQDLHSSATPTFSTLTASTFLIDGVTAGITASTTQTQGQGALTTAINEVATVANVNDTVTLPSAVAGTKVVIINNGANTLQIFPASGDNLGAGVDTAITLASGSNVVYVAYDTTNWESI